MIILLKLRYRIIKTKGTLDQEGQLSPHQVSYIVNIYSGVVGPRFLYGT